MTTLFQSLPIQPFIFHSPTRVVFGEDTASGAREALRGLGGEKTFIITDANLIKAGVLDSVLAGFKADGVERPVIFDAVPPDSDIDCVENAAAIARRHQCDSFLAIGGGSVTDTMKVVNIMLTFGGDLLEYQGLNNLPRPLLPMVAIPTTAGTGSEVSFVAMIKDAAEGKKLLFGSEFLAPNIAILDPKLLVSLPARLTAATGMDALTHDLESFVAAATTSAFTDALCIQSARLLFEHLPRATRNGDDLSARAATLVASTMAGVAFTNTGVGVVHALAHTIGGKFATHHGMTNAVFLPHGIEFNLAVVSERYAMFARAAGISSAQDDLKAARDLRDAVKGLILECNLPHSLSGLGVPELKSDTLAELALIASTDPAIMFNPRESTVDDLSTLIQRAY